METARRFRLVVLLMLVCACAWGDANRPLEKFIPADVLVYARFRGLDKASDDFKGTAIRDILAEPQVKAFREELARTVSTALDSLIPGLAAKCSELTGVLGCEVALAVLDDGRVVFLVDPGPHAKTLREIIDLKVEETKKAGVAVKEIRHGDIRIVHLDETTVAWVDGRLILAQDRPSFQRVLRTFLGEVPSIATDPELRSMRAKTLGAREFFMLHLRVDRLAKSLGGSVSGWDEVQPVLASLGLLDVKCVHLSVAPDAPGVRCFLYLHTPDGPKGLLRLLPREPLDEKRMLAQVPAGTRHLLLMRTDWPALIDVPADVFNALGQGEYFQQALRQANESLGLDLRNALLDAMGDELLIHVPPGNNKLADASLIVTLRDEAKFRASVEKLLQVAPPDRVKVRKLDRRGVTVYVIENASGTSTTPIKPFHFVVGKGRLVVADDRDAVVKMLNESPVAAKSLLADATFMRLRRRMPAKVSFIGYMDLRGELTEAYAFLRRELAAAGDKTATDAGDWPFPDIAPLLEKLPETAVLRRHLFGSIATFRFDGEGFMFESYGPFGGLATPAILDSVEGGNFSAGIPPAKTKTTSTPRSAKGAGARRTPKP